VGAVDAEAILRAHGGCVRWRALRRVVSRRALARAVADGRVARDERGTYALPETGRAEILAKRLRGFVSHRSAARHWQFAMLRPLTRHDVTVPRKSRRTAVPDDARLRYRDLAPDDVVDGVTSPVRTVLDCLRDLPLDEALAIGDSALRSGRVRWSSLRAGAGRLSGPGSRRVRDRLALLDARAANAFESACRAILVGAGFRGFRPQVRASEGRLLVGRVDLADVALRIAVECDSFAHHADRAGLRRDCRRYTMLARLGWSLVRVSWEDVMSNPDWVADSVRDVVARRTPVREPRALDRQAA
jgi:very-short-patch-repair endonuclease